MIHVVFVEPNFRYQYRATMWGEDQQLRIEVALAFARDEEELRQDILRLRREAISIEKYDFAEWRARADKAKAAAILDFHLGKIEFDQSIWACVKSYLFTIFHGKCAYCETSIGVACPGDVEHYRPKRKVEEAEDHPGYYWLAYDISNLFPCCENCNRFKGKRNHFPIEGVRCSGPDCEATLTSEKPLLLNPYVDDNIEHHLQFWTPKLKGDEKLLAGTMRGTTDKGTRSVKIYNLDREPLNIARAKAQRNALDALRLAMAHSDEEFFKRFESFRSGRNEYSAAVKAYVSDWWDKIRKRLEPG
jgi:hypothetical protein